MLRFDPRRAALVKGIIACLTNHPDGLTGSQIATMLETEIRYVAPRLTELGKASGFHTRPLIKSAGMVATKGRPATVYVLA